MSQGGMTACTITVNGEDFVGEAVCSFSDNFNYKIGRAIAHGRALKLVEEAYGQ